MLFNLLYSIIMKQFTTLITLIAISATVNSEVFTSIADMEGLLKIEDILITNFRSYLTNQENLLKTIRNKIEEYERVHKDAKMDASSYLANPINAYLITKRLTKDWHELQNSIISNQADVMLRNITTHRIEYKNPTEKDLKGVSVALARLQGLYKLNASSMANGGLSEASIISKMTANDCYQLGMQLHKAKDFVHAAQWLEEAITQLNGTDVNFQIQILENLSQTYYHQKKYANALAVTENILVIFPNHISAIKNKFLYTMKHKQQTNSYEQRPETETKKIDPLYFDDIQRDSYEKLCRKELVSSPKQLAPLRCRYVHDNSPFLKIAPLKLEEASLDPYIVVYYDVIYDSEIELVKAMAMPRFKRAGVDLSNDPDAIIYADYRISKSAWLSDKAHKVIATISKRVKDMTGLSMEYTEDLQVVNYGIGGHYEPHFDFAMPGDKTEFDDLGVGNRIATVLIYMSDVIAGGGTVFPLINVSLWPVKGAGAFWYNLYASGAGDLRTKHAGCPVLIGSKWVANKWLHEKDQELIRLCKLQPDHPPTPAKITKKKRNKKH